VKVNGNQHCRQGKISGVLVPDKLSNIRWKVWEPTNLSVGREHTSKFLSKFSQTHSGFVCSIIRNEETSFLTLIPGRLPLNLSGLRSSRHPHWKTFWPEKSNFNLNMRLRPKLRPPPPFTSNSNGERNKTRQLGVTKH
jgi:hypothetical protein